jgi:hypothetical protein
MALTVVWSVTYVFSFRIDFVQELNANEHRRAARLLANSAVTGQCVPPRDRRSPPNILTKTCRNFWSLKYQKSSGVGVKNIEEVFSGNPDETARAVGVSDETRPRHLPSTSQKRSLVKACLIEHKSKWKPHEFHITFPFDGDYFHYPCGLCEIICWSKRVLRRENFLLSLGFEPRTVQPVEIHFTRPTINDKCRAKI